MKKALIYIGALILISTLVIIWSWGYSDIPLEILREKYANDDSRFMNVQGMDVHYRLEGNEQDSIPLLLLHGSGASLHTWDGWVDELKASIRIIRLDLPAFGLTGPTTDRKYSMQIYLRVLVDLLDKLDVRQVDIAGNSLGGHIAWYMALRAPERVRKLILIDAVGYPIEDNQKPIAFRLATIPFLNKAFTFITPRFIVRNSIVDLYADKSKVREVLVDRYFELSLRPGNRDAFIDRAMDAFADSSFQEISTINHPTLILWGSEDRFVPLATGNKFHRDLPNDTLIILQNIGHMPMEESPEMTASLAKEFLKRK